VCSVKEVEKVDGDAVSADVVEDALGGSELGRQRKENITAIWLWYRSFALLLIVQCSACSCTANDAGRSSMRTSQSHDYCTLITSYNG